VRLDTIVRRELFERRTQVITSFLAVLLGIAVIVSVKTVSYYSEKAVSRELDALGANILVLPKSISVQDYYSADMEGSEIPEEYVTRLVMSDLEGLDNLSPKLSVPVELQGRSFTLTGILPKQEFQAKAMWQGAGIFSRPQGCGVVGNVPGLSEPPPKETLVRDRVIDDLGEYEALVGADVAALVGVESGESITLLGQSFSVVAVLPRTGTVDDSRVFAHLHTVQELAGKGPVINAIEVVGCCIEISKGLVEKINRLLPEAEVVTIGQIIETQINTNQMMRRLSGVFVLIIAAVGCVSIANYMFANVFERRREIGTLMALGARPSFVMNVFLLKAAVLGVAGGIGGYLLGTLSAVTLGPKLAGIPVLPIPSLAAWGVGISVAIAMAGSYLPARRAARMDPFDALQEV
jgi:putative ABC transport system permease protein